MKYIYERKINYYETDKMGVVHHSNYIRFLEEARCYWLESLGMPFASFEENDVTIPVLEVNCTYKHHVTFGDTLLINVIVKEYSGVRMTVSYEVLNKETNQPVIFAETKHCITNRNLKPINLKKYIPEYDEKFRKLKAEN